MRSYYVRAKPYIMRKIAATVIDYAIYFSLFYLYMSLYDEAPATGVATVTGVKALPIFLLWFLYFPVLEAVNQATPGHDICKLKIYTLTGQKPTLAMCIKRRVMDFVDIFMYAIPALICINKTEKHQRLGDLWAGTLVVQTSDVLEDETSY